MFGEDGAGEGGIMTDRVSGEGRLLQTGFRVPERWLAVVLVRIRTGLR